jgi:uncharacterized membrane protein YhaH (DUF805 family)
MQRLLSYFSFQGRANRQRYWITGVTIFMLFFLAALLAGALAELPVVGILGGLLFLVLIPAIFVAVLANGARRLHDRGHSAWWLILFVGVPTLLSIPAELAKSSGNEGAQMVTGLLALLGLPFSIWGFVVMGCLKGTTGPNRFGDDPLQPAVQEIFA